MILAALLAGLVAGVLSGLLGIGGGGILVASAVLFMGAPQHVAQASALAASIPTALVGALKHHRNKLINYQAALYLALGSVFGGMAGAYLANLISELTLRRLFSVFFAVMSIQLFWSSWPRKTPAQEKDITG